MIFFGFKEVIFEDMLEIILIPYNAYVALGPYYFN